MLERLAAVAGGMVPSDNANQRQQYLWRLRVGLVLCGTFLGLISVTVLAFGFAQPAFAGFARANDVQSLAQSTISQQLLELRTKQCKAQTSEARQLYFQLMAEALQQYERLTGRTWSVPPCDSL